MSEETTVVFDVEGQRVVGTLRLVDTDAAPIFLLLHGFTGTRDELVIPQTGTGIFAYLAAKLEALGYSSLRIDFRGSGDSDGKFEDTTYSGQIADCIAAMDFVAGLPQVDARKIVLLGWSQGGLVAAVAAGRTNRPAGIALWAAVGEPAVSFPMMVGQDAYHRGLSREGATALEMPWGEWLSLGHSFFAEVRSFDPFEEIEPYRGPVFIAEGTLDTAIPQGTAQEFANAHRGANKVWQAPMDHAFNTSQNVATLDQLITATTRFFSWPE